MKTIKNYAKLLLGVAVLGAALLMQSFGENLKAARKLAGIHRYYNTTGMPSTNPADYVYQDESDLLCNENDEKDCSAEWNLGTANPTIGQAPPNSATFVPNSISKGEFQQ